MGNRKIIYIMGDNRSGSTLLENILSKSDECFSVGELNMLKGHLLKEEPGSRWNWNCSCGQLLTECAFWKPIIENYYFPELSKFDTRVHWNIKSKKLFFISLFPLLLNSKLLSLIYTKKNKIVTDTLNNLYHAVSIQSGKNVIIDSSKNPIQALAVYKTIKDFGVKVIWLKRDLRAIATSKRKWKTLNKRKQKTLSTLLWEVFYYRLICYAVTTLIPKKDIIPLNYESLALNTKTELIQIIQKVGLQSYPTPRFMELIKDHTIGGTPERFKKKPIQLDDKWKDEYKQNKCSFLIGYILNKIC